MPLPTCLLIATPTRGQMEACYVHSLLQLQALSVSKGISLDYYTFSGSLIAHSRNMLVDIFLRHPHATHLLFIDDDIGFTAPDIELLLTHADKDVIAAPCPMRHMNWANIKKAVLANPDIDPAHLAHLGGTYDATLALAADTALTIDRSPVRCRAVGTGLMLISRAVLERLLSTGDIPRYDHREHRGVAEFFRVGVSNKRMLGEDHYFCALVQRSGGEVWCAPWVMTRHAGTHEFIGDLLGIATYLPEADVAMSG